MNIEIGPKELEFLQFFKECTEHRIYCYDDKLILEKKYMSVKEKCEMIIEFKNNREFCERALEWLNRVMS